MKNLKKFSFTLFLCLGFYLVQGANGYVYAQDKTLSPDEEKIIQRTKEAVMKELRESDFLKKEIERGIQNYIEETKKLQREAKAENERRATEAAKNVRRVSSKRDHIFGNPDAEVSLIEYSDFECPFCKRFHPVPKKIVEAYGGRVNWVYRQFPLSFHNPGAQTEAEASECAAELGGNDAFWKFADRIFERTTSNGHGFPLDKLTPLAGEIGLDKDKFNACLHSDKYLARIKEGIKEGVKSGVTGTPASILLNSRTGQVMRVNGALPYSAVKAKIDKLLN